MFIPFKYVQTLNPLLIEQQKAYEETVKSIPLKRFGTVVEISNLAFFILSPESAFINGECITMDGGRWLNRQVVKE